MNRPQQVEVAVIGAGPAGLSAAEAAARHGATVLILDRNPIPGGQLNKQTHMFFGSREQYAATRGFHIAALMEGKLAEFRRCRMELDSWVLGIYPDNRILVNRAGEIRLIEPSKIIVATGAMENPLAFPGCDLPGVYGAGAVQTLMNLYGIKPGRRAVMVGAGNIGLIVSYQLLQAGVDVAAVVEASPSIGGYWVHASKIRRLGVPIYTSTTIARACGETCLESVCLHALDSTGVPVPGSGRSVEADILCLAVGLTPLTELLQQAGCRMAHLSRLGGSVPCRDRRMATSNPHIYVAGDVAGIGEASQAIMEGKIAGLAAAADLGLGGAALDQEMQSAWASWEELMAGDISQSRLDAIMELERQGGVRND